MAAFGSSEPGSNNSGGSVGGGFGQFTIPDVSRIDPNKITKHRSPDFIQVSGRDGFSQLGFNTGVVWLGGFATAGAYGFVEGWKSATSSNYKIRFNSVMNAVSKRGSTLANSLAVIGERYILVSLMLVEYILTFSSQLFTAPSLSIYSVSFVSWVFAV